MALSTYGTNHALAVRFWAKKLAAEALRKTFFADLIGRSTDSVIVRRDEMKEAGDRVTVGLRAQLTGAGVSGDGTLEGNEEALATYGDTLLIDQLRNGVRSAGRMSEQRVLFDFREEAKAGLGFFGRLFGIWRIVDRTEGGRCGFGADQVAAMRPS